MRFLSSLILGAARACLLSHVSLADRLEDFQKAKKSVTPQLRSKQPASRIEALKKLEAYPLEDSVRMVYNGLSDAEEDVREAAYASLMKMNGNQEVCDTLVLIVKKQLGRRDDGHMAAPGIAVLLASELPSVRRDSLDFVDETVAAGKQGIPAMITLAEQLGQHGQPFDIVPLVRLSKTRIFAEHFGLRRTVGGSLKRIRCKEAIGGLIWVVGTVGC